MNHTFEDLIEKRLDGSISREESIRLENQCRENEQVRQALDLAVRTDELVSVLPDAEPPAALRARIMDSLPDNPPWQAHMTPDRVAFSRERRNRRRAWVPALFGFGGLSLGAALATLVMLIWSTGTSPDALSPWDQAQVTGTMSAADAPAMSSEGELAGGGSYSINVWKTESVMQIRAAGISPRGAALIFSYPPGDLRLNSVLDRAMQATQQPHLTAESGRFESSVSGLFDIRITMQIEQESGSMGVRLLDNGRPALDKKVEY